ncbi:agamous-like MADS-box protein AGL93 [Ipomoea triloba]|uniref:agamous-like MADS-box protein AGL93 n=1 Tax=Ipomoea triloba TaxID=35885 RepID=UPI00125CFDF4|nr:agamous-like MADS-box protein AGL93 [Ipomoea triloba]
MAEKHGKKAMKTKYENRKTSILKKSKELSTLCDVQVCVIVVSPDGKLETWPDNLNDVKAVLSTVKESRKPIRSENLREIGDRSRLCSRIKIPKSVKGKEIDVENCGNNGAGVVDEEELYDVSGADQENNNAKQDNTFGTGIPAGMSHVDMRVNQTPTSHYSYYHQWNGNGNGNGEINCEKFGKYIGDMVTNQESYNLAAYYGCGSSSSSMNPKTQFCNMHPNQEPSPHQYEMGSSSSSAFNFGFNFSNQQQPTPLIAYHHQQHYDVIGNNISALNTTDGLNNNMQKIEKKTNMNIIIQKKIFNVSFI